MAEPRITQQTTSTTLPLTGGLARGAPHPKPLHRGSFAGGLQWALEGPGWSVLRPVVDCVLLCTAVVVALGGVHDTLSVSAVQAPLLALPPLAMGLLFVRGLYRTRLRALVLDGVVPVLSAVSVAAMTVAMIGLLVNGQAPGQSEGVRAWLLALLGVGLGRIVLAGAQRWARGRRLVGKPVLIVGAGMVGSQVARRLEKHPEYGLVPVGFVDDDPRSIAEVGGRDVPVLGTVEDVDGIVEKTGADKVIVAFSSVADARISRLIQRCQRLGVDVSVVPRMFDTMNQRAWYDTVGGTPLVSFSTIDPKGWQFALKHAFDRVFALLLLVVLSPLMFVAALAVKLSSPGPVLYRQRRVGRDGKVFDLYKFRSMRLARRRGGARDDRMRGTPDDGMRGARDDGMRGAPDDRVRGMRDDGMRGTRDDGMRGMRDDGMRGTRDDRMRGMRDDGMPADGITTDDMAVDGALTDGALTEDDETALQFLLGGDTAPGGVEGEDRRTLVGRVMRRTSIDELPQLLNVLKGEMSVIGPRPERPEFVELFEQDVARYGERHRVKAGITGWAQVHGLRGQTSLAERVEWDNYYIAHWSLGLDLKILALTLVAMVRSGE